MIIARFLFIVVGTAIYIAIKGCSGNCRLADLRIHCVMALMMLCTLELFQFTYIVVMRDALPIWPRYLFQHHWLIHIILGAVVSYLTVYSGVTPVGWVYRICAALLLGIGVAWAVRRSISYYKNPFHDTGMAQAANGARWRHAYVLLLLVIQSYSRAC
jgi:hypothetical protein